MATGPAHLASFVISILASLLVAVLLAVFGTGAGAVVVVAAILLTAGVSYKWGYGLGTGCLGGFIVGFVACLVLAYVGRVPSPSSPILRIPVAPGQLNVTELEKPDDWLIPYRHELERRDPHTDVLSIQSRSLDVPESGEESFKWTLNPDDGYDITGYGFRKTGNKADGGPVLYEPLELAQPPEASRSQAASPFRGIDFDVRGAKEGDTLVAVIRIGWPPGHEPPSNSLHAFESKME